MPRKVAYPVLNSGLKLYLLHTVITITINLITIIFTIIITIIITIITIIIKVYRKSKERPPLLLRQISKVGRPVGGLHDEVADRIDVPEDLITIVAYRIDVPGDD